MSVPDTIFLQWYAEDGEPADEVTHCVDRIHKNDIEYRRVKRRSPAGPDWRALCRALITARDTNMVQFWQAVGRIAQAVEATERPPTEEAQ